MNKKKLLFCTGEGLGNIIQTIPLLRTLYENTDYIIDFCICGGSFDIPKIIPYVDRWYRSYREIENIREYDGKIITYWCRNFRPIYFDKLKMLNKISRISFNRSEVDVYMDIARQLKISEEKLKWWGKCLYNKTDEHYDIVVHNGFNYKNYDMWKHKSYLYYEELVRMLNNEGYKIASIGATHEYIHGTINRTNMSLLDSLGIIKNAKLFISNDTGTYHAANALGVPNIVIFTFTSIIKNYDPRFHRYAIPIYDEDLECRARCQKLGLWKQCKFDYKCRKIDPFVVYKKVISIFS